MTITTDTLSELFHQGCKPAEEYCIGAEFEFFVVDSNFHLIPYCCEGGVEETLQHMSARCSWERVYEAERLVALNRQQQTVTIEPSGAIEFSTSPAKSLAEIDSQRNLFLKQLALAAEKFGHKILMVGVLPFDSIDSVELVPKARYRFMYDYMPEVGSRGREMMKLTSAVQVSIDYSSEEDALRKYRLAALSTPVFLALSANSTIQDGKYQRVASLREDIWANTDNHRCGIPPFVFYQEADFQSYVNWALDIPMYFAIRGGRLYCDKQPAFREFIKGTALPAADMPDPEATMADWEVHLSTLFPWVRMKRYIEVRAFDMCCPKLQSALVALVKGLFYDDVALDSLEELVGSFDSAFAHRLLQQAGKNGLDGTVGTVSLRELAKDILQISGEGLFRQNDEVPALTPLELRVENWSLEAVSASIEEKGICGYLEQYVPQNSLLAGENFGDSTDKQTGAGVRV